MHSTPEHLLKMRHDKPPLVIQQKAEGWLLNENAKPKPKQSSGPLGWIIGGFFLVLFSWFFLIAGLIFLVIALFIPSVRHYIRAYFFLLPGDLIFSHYPLRLGGDDRVTFRRKLKGDRKFPKNGEVRIKLFCVERVSYSQGTDTITETAIILEKKLRSQSILSGTNEIICHFDLDLLSHLPPSFEGKNNQIRWIIVVEQKMPDIAENVDSNFTLLVEP